MEVAEEKTSGALPVVTLCMGSSCFARGNEKNLEIVEQFLREHRLEASVKLTGLRCQGECAVGPNLAIDGVEYRGVAPEKFVELLTARFL